MGIDVLVTVARVGVFTAAALADRWIGIPVAVPAMVAGLSIRQLLDRNRDREPENWFPRKEAP